MVCCIFATKCYSYCSIWQKALANYICLKYSHKKFRIWLWLYSISGKYFNTLPNVLLLFSVLMQWSVDWSNVFQTLVTCYVYCIFKAMFNKCNSTFDLRTSLKMRLCSSTKANIFWTCHLFKNFYSYFGLSMNIVRQPRLQGAVNLVQDPMVQPQLTSRWGHFWGATAVQISVS